ncbi:hypothetical protein [Spirosoma pulveris]
MIQKLSNRLRFLDSLIRKRATGSPKELAQRLGITERAWYKIRDELINDLNLPLAYDPVRKTYYYTEEGQFIFGFQRKLTNDDMEKLEGGRSHRYRWRNGFGQKHAASNSSEVLPA